MTITVALAGDVMLGRSVAAHLDDGGHLVDDDVAALLASADLVVANLECAISQRGEPWPDPAKPFFFRAPPMAADVLAELGVDAVTLANNHALDFGPEALIDTAVHLDRVGIAHTGAGVTAEMARRPVVVSAGGLRLAVLGLSDHPPDYAATDDRPGIAYADLRGGVPDWVGARLGEADADLRLVTPHWGPNMVGEPVAHVRAAAPQLVAAGADLVAGHSAHVVQGVAMIGGRPVLYDLGDFVDDYAVDPALRNDLGLLWLAEVGADGVHGVEAVPLRLDYCRTRLADGADADWMAERLQRACRALGTDADRHDGRLRVHVGAEG